MKNALLIFLSLVVLKSYSQPLPVWSSDIQSNLGFYFLVRPKIKFDHSGDLIVVGNILSPSADCDILVAKYDTSGNILWQQSFDHVGFHDEVNDFEIDAQNNICITGSAMTDSLDGDLLTLRYDASGNFQWFNTFPSAGTGVNSGYSITTDNSGNIYVTGLIVMDPLNYDRKFIILKIDTSGNTIWNNQFGNQGWNIGRKIRLVNNRVIAAGQTSSTNSPYNQHAVAKLDTNGTIVFFNQGLIWKGIEACYIDHEGNSYFGSPVYYKITKVDSSGQFVWNDSTLTNLPPNISADEVVDITADSLLNVYTTGRHYGIDFFDPWCTKSDILTVKYSSSGNKLWMSRYSHMAQNTDIGFCILTDQYLNVYSGGYSSHYTDTTHSDFVLVKYDSSGNETGLIRYNSPANEDDGIMGIALKDTSCIYVTGVTMNTQLNAITTQKYCSFSGVGLNEFQNEPAINIYPNPFNSSITVDFQDTGFKKYSLRVFDISGKLYYNNTYESGITTISLNQLNPGFYLLQLQDADRVFQFKVIRAED